MSARESRGVILAVAYMLRTGLKPADVAARYKVSRASIYRALKRRGLQFANPNQQAGSLAVPLDAAPVADLGVVAPNDAV